MDRRFAALEAEQAGGGYVAVIVVSGAIPRKSPNDPPPRTTRPYTNTRQLTPSGQYGSPLRRFTPTSRARTRSAQLSVQQGTTQTPFG